MYALMEREVFIRARKADNELVEKAAKVAAAEFKKNAGFTVETEIDTDNPLGAERYRRFGLERQTLMAVLGES